MFQNFDTCRSFHQYCKGRENFLGSSWDADKSAIVGFQNYCIDTRASFRCSVVHFLKMEIGIPVFFSFSASPTMVSDSSSIEVAAGSLQRIHHPFQELHQWTEKENICWLLSGIKGVRLYEIKYTINIEPIKKIQPPTQWKM